MQKSFDKSKGRWRVSLQANGVQHRKFFPSETEADAFMATRKTDVRQFGEHWLNLPPLERIEIQTQLHRLAKLGWRLREAVDFLERCGKTPPALPLENIAREFLAAKEAAGCRPRYLAKLRASIDRFLTGRREKPISDVTPAEVQEYTTRNGWAPRTAKSYLIDVRTLFSFAVKRRYCRENVALTVDLPRLEDKPPGILTVPQCSALLAACLKAEPTLLPTIALCLLAGIRPEESQRLEWANVLPKYVEVPGAKSKTRRRRLVPITDQLAAWLETSRALGGELPVANFATKFNHVRRVAGLKAGWPHDAMRHSFASYHFARGRNENETAFIMGNSPQMLYAHYRELVLPEEAGKFFALLPGTVGEAKASASQAADTAPPPAARRGNRTITKAALGAIFAHGQRRLSRQDAIAELCDVHGLSQSTAYAALSPSGRFHHHLREAGGLLAWEPFPKERIVQTGGRKAPAPVADSQALPILG